MPAIRPYQPKDKERVRMVCIQVGLEEGKREGPPRSVQQTTYCDYYIECEPHNCFVIADDNDQAVGYIICAESYWPYYERFLREYVPRVRDLRFPKRVQCWGAAWMPRWFAKKYPAHLHINIMEDYQRQGLGSQLVDTLAAHLRAKGVPGVMLGVGPHNVKGRSF